jgi:hypothetical protein
MGGRCSVALDAELADSAGHFEACRADLLPVSALVPVVFDLLVRRAFSCCWCCAQ